MPREPARSSRLSSWRLAVSGWPLCSRTVGRREYKRTWSLKDMRMRDYRSNAMRAVDRARRLAHRAAMEAAIEDGAQALRRPAYPGAEYEVRDVEPMAGFRAAHELEIGARYTARRYLRDAREAGFTWHDIGMAMDAGMRRMSERAGGSAAELAYQYAVERADQPGPRYDMSFSWTCQSCDKLII